MKCFIVAALIAGAMVFSRCSADDVSGPDVGSNEVGLRNDTYETAVWGIFYTETSRYVDERESDVLPYSENGYWVNAYGSWDIQSAYPDPGQTIVFYKSGNNYKVRITG